MSLHKYISATLYKKNWYIYKKSLKFLWINLKNDKKIIGVISNFFWL